MFQKETEAVVLLVLQIASLFCDSFYSITNMMMITTGVVTTTRSDYKQHLHLSSFDAEPNYCSLLNLFLSSSSKHALQSFESCSVLCFPDFHCSMWLEFSEFFSIFDRRLIDSCVSICWSFWSWLTIEYAHKEKK